MHEVRAANEDIDAHEVEESADVPLTAAGATPTACICNSVENYAAAQDNYVIVYNTNEVVR